MSIERLIDHLTVRALRKGVHEAGGDASRAAPALDADGVLLIGAACTHSHSGAPAPLYAGLQGRGHTAVGLLMPAWASSGGSVDMHWSLHGMPELHIA